MSNELKHAGVYVPPPSIFLAIFLISWLVQKYAPIPDDFFSMFPSKFIGGLFMAAGMASGGTAALRFYRNKTTILAHKPVAFLQTGGIYRYTRNPMYLGLLLVYTGAGCWLANGWTLLLSPLAILIMNHFVIRKEERYLRHAFGKNYEAYCTRVRRWI